MVTLPTSAAHIHRFDDQATARIADHDAISPW